jgi:hypothetical protein
VRDPRERAGARRQLTQEVVMVRERAFRRRMAAVTMCVCAVLVSGAALTAPIVSAAAKKTEAAKPAVAKDAATAAAKSAPAPDSSLLEMMKYATPGPQHAWLKKGEGDWKATVKMWSGPGDPVVSEGVSENRMILGGRYLEQRYTGAMYGQPFEGYGLTGFDNRTQQFFGMWVDNSSTGLMTSYGSTDDSGKSLTMKSTMPGPDGKPMESRTVTMWTDDNTMVYSMYGTIGGKEMLMMEITYIRAQ